MVVHGFIPSETNTSTLVPIPKNTKKSLNDSDNYIIAIALSSVFVSCWTRSFLKNIPVHLLPRIDNFWQEGAYSTTQCTFVVNEVINYYNSKGTTVKVDMLDASKAFDRARYVKLLRLLLLCDRGMILQRDKFVSSYFEVYFEHVCQTMYLCKMG